MTANLTHDVMIIGAGPAGLACAIEAKKRTLSSLVIDKGSVVDAIRRFPVNLVFFSTPELLEIGNVPFIVPTFRPTRIDIVRYYHRVAKDYALPIVTGAEVTSVEKKGELFEIVTSGGHYRGRNIVFATGYFDNPNPFDVPGSHLPKVLRYYSEPFQYSGKRVAVVGGKNSAVEIALELFRNGADVTLIHRGPRFSDGVKYWILPDIENRIKAGEVKALFETRVKEITPSEVILEGKHAGRISNDTVFVMIGYRPDNRMLEKAGVDIDPVSLAPSHDPATMETNVKGIYLAGSIAAGKLNNKIFIENGRLHGALIVESICKK
ncbi:MAG TPA: YpdA family putative bacillithiol disulfide reductase [Bacteroidota bacterium]